MLIKAMTKDVNTGVTDMLRLDAFKHSLIVYDFVNYYNYEFYILLFWEGTFVYAKLDSHGRTK